jgi:hypothetical protein
MPNIAGNNVSPHSRRHRDSVSADHVDYQSAPSGAKSLDQLVGPRAQFDSPRRRFAILFSNESCPRFFDYDDAAADQFGRLYLTRTAPCLSAEGVQVQWSSRQFQTRNYPQATMINAPRRAETFQLWF